MGLNKLASFTGSRLFCFINFRMAFTKFSLESVFEAFSHQTILVIGDLMLDQYIVGKATRISPEAPVPVLEFDHESNNLGGAANVAINIKSLGANAIPLGVVGTDEAGLKLLELFRSHQISTDGILACESRVTTVKTRIMAGGQHVLRLDREVTGHLDEKAENELLQKAKSLIYNHRIDGIVLQDYNKGVLSESVIKWIIEEARMVGIPIMVDPKFHSFWHYKGVQIFKPNLKEVSQIIGYEVKPDLASLSVASSQIREKLGAKAVLITLSEKGIFFDDGQSQGIVTTKARLLADPCGAGDSVISVATLALIAGLSIFQVAQLANLAGGQVVEKSGVVAVDRELLLSEALQQKILD